jgi:AbrB family looped-hinge helix DNA binding protein
MTTTITSKGQVTVPKPIRDALGLEPGIGVNFNINESGQIVLSKAGGRHKAARPDRFESARGRSELRWRTKDLMALLRGDD